MQENKIQIIHKIEFDILCILNLILIHLHQIFQSSWTKGEIADFSTSSNFEVLGATWSTLEATWSVLQATWNILGVTLQILEATLYVLETTLHILEVYFETLEVTLAYLKLL